MRSVNEPQAVAGAIELFSTTDAGISDVYAGIYLSPQSFKEPKRQWRSVFFLLRLFFWHILALN